MAFFNSSKQTKIASLYSTIHLQEQKKPAAVNKLFTLISILLVQ